MNFSTYQLLAVAAMVASMAIAIALGYWEGRRSSTRSAEQQQFVLRHLKCELNRVQHDYSISRRDAALALEVLTEERDTAQADAAALRLRLITTREQLETLQAQQQERAA